MHAQRLKSVIGIRQFTASAICNQSFITLQLYTRVLTFFLFVELQFHELDLVL